MLKKNIGCTALALVMATSLLFSGCGKKTQEKPTPKPLTVNQKVGSEDATIKSKVNIDSYRKIKFNASIKDIKKAEKKNKDTVKSKTSPSETTSKDGYTYLAYTFADSAKNSIFGAVPVADGSLTYVFKDKSLKEVRVDYGSLDENAYTAICEFFKNEFGDPSFSRTYSNNSKNSWWKTNKAKVDVNYSIAEIYDAKGNSTQQSKIIVYYSSVEEKK